MSLYDALATYRLTRLVTADVVLDGPRDQLVRWAYRRAGRANEVWEAEAELGPVTPGQWAGLAMADDNPPKLATLVTCRWCAGMWIALGVVAARRLCPRAWAPLARALTYSAGAALLARLED